MSKVEEIRELTFKCSVPFEVISRDEYKEEYMSEGADEEFWELAQQEYEAFIYS